MRLALKEAARAIASRVQGWPGAASMRAILGQGVEQQRRPALQQLRRRGGPAAGEAHELDQLARGGADRGEGPFEQALPRPPVQQFGAEVEDEGLVAGLAPLRMPGAGRDHGGVQQVQPAPAAFDVQFDFAGDRQDDLGEGVAVAQRLRAVAAQV